jgi:hypothetical protein
MAEETRRPAVGVPVVLTARARIVTTHSREFIFVDRKRMKSNM